MFRRKGTDSFYTRVYAGGREVWRALGADYTEACRKLRALRRSEAPLRRSVLLADVARSWQESYVKTARSPYNQRQTDSRTRSLLLRFYGPVSLSKVTRDSIRQYRLWLEKRGLKPLTVVHVLADLRCLLNWCVENDLVDYSTFPKRVMPRIQERPPDRLTDKEVEAVIRITDPHGFVARLALATGLRWGELARLQCGDIQDGVIVVQQTKSGRVRRVPVARWFAPELRNRVGKMVPFSSPGQFNTRVKKLSGVTRFHVHQLRHTFACRYLESGGSLAVLQELLGHSTVRMTQHYARLADDYVRREFERLDDQTVAETVAGRNEAVR
jgi:integrase